MTAARGDDRFVGAAACAGCHPRETEAWSGSHHAQAMQVAGPTTVLGDFADARFANAARSARFERRDGTYVARTAGADGTPGEHEIAYTFGVAPLQQYLVRFPRGRLQALEIAWDSRPAAAGGQRWFDLRAGERIDPHDPLHWTGLAERWNYMCADCHSTNVRKGYDAASDRYDTRFAEIAVSCEACHGPGARHVTWAAGDARSRAVDPTRGLAVALDERRGASWIRDAATGKPHRSTPRESQRELETCARCHARRGLIHEDHVHGQPLGDDYRVALLEPELYWPDGQIKDEVYEYGSFLQSRMNAAGVTCSDCHDPHRPSLREAGDFVCLRCHTPDRYFTPRHHFHAASSAGARCVSCHMPAKTYMVVDPRRDHSLRIPRPDLTVALGVPNACNGCHRDRPATWAVATTRRWYGHAPSGFQQFATALAAGARGEPGADAALASLVLDDEQPGIARATAMASLGHDPELGAAPLAHAVRDRDAVVRAAAARWAAGADVAMLLEHVPPLLADPVRAVRIEATRALAPFPSAALPANARAPFERAAAEMIAAEELAADIPQSHVNLANWYVRRGDVATAEVELRRALALDPRFAPATVNLADLCRATGREDEGVALLEAGLQADPRNPALLHALGLARVRARRTQDALALLEAAARLDAGVPRYAFVYAVALHDDGQVRRARAVLEALLARHPSDRNARAALAAYAPEPSGRTAAQAPR